MLHPGAPGDTVTILQTEPARRESDHLAPTYHPLPVVLARGEGSRVWDVDGRCYLRSEERRVG